MLLPSDGSVFFNIDTRFAFLLYTVVFDVVYFILFYATFTHLCTAVSWAGGPSVGRT